MKKFLLIATSLIIASLAASAFGISLFLLNVHEKSVTASFSSVYSLTFGKEMREAYYIAEPYLDTDQRINLLKTQILMNIKLSDLDKRKDEEAIKSHPGVSIYFKAVEEALEKSPRYADWKGSDAQRKMENLKAFENDTRMIGQSFVRGSVFRKDNHLESLRILKSRIPTTTKERSRKPVSGKNSET